MRREAHTVRGRHKNRAPGTGVRLAPGIHLDGAQVQDAGSVRLVNLMRLLLDLGWKVTFAPDNRAWVPRYTADLQQLGVEVLYQPS